jgi:hypothetical protein
MSSLVVPGARNPGWSRTWLPLGLSFTIHGLITLLTTARETKLAVAQYNYGHETTA